MTPSECKTLFLQERERFARHHPHLAQVRLVLEERHYLPRPAARDLAWVKPPEPCVHLLRRALELPPANVVGLLRHELAHLADGGLSEEGADGLAGRVAGAPIHYDPAGIQTTGPGGPRPAGLRRNPDEEQAGWLCPDGRVRKLKYLEDHAEVGWEVAGVKPGSSLFVDGTQAALSKGCIRFKVDYVNGKGWKVVVHLKAEPTDAQKRFLGRELREAYRLDLLVEVPGGVHQQDFYGPTMGQLLEAIHQLSKRPIKKLEPVRGNPMRPPTESTGLLLFDFRRFLVGGSFVLLDTAALAAGAPTDECVLGYMSMEDMGDGLWQVRAVWAKEGWGPLVYDVALTLVRQNKGRALLPDTDQTAAAKRVWAHYREKRLADVTPVGSGLAAKRALVDIPTLTGRAERAAEAAKRTDNYRGNTTEEIRELLQEEGATRFPQVMERGGRTNPGAGTVIPMSKVEAALEFANQAARGAGPRENPGRDALVTLIGEEEAAKVAGRTMSAIASAQDGLLESWGLSARSIQTIRAAVAMYLEAARECPLPTDVQLSSPAEVDRAMRPRLALLDQEETWALYLTRRLTLLKDSMLTRATPEMSLVDPRQVFREAIRLGAVKVILVHNHPGGDPAASSEDKQTTRRMARLGQELGIQLMDHVIIGKHGFLSLAQDFSQLFEQRVNPSP